VGDAQSQSIVAVGAGFKPALYLFTKSKIGWSFQQIQGRRAVRSAKMRIS
jgi:hypothetical protein